MCANELCSPHRHSLIAGLTLEAARWDAEAGCLADSLPGQLRQVGQGDCRLKHAAVHSISQATRMKYLAGVAASCMRSCLLTRLLPHLPPWQALPVLHIRPVTSEAYAEAVAAGDLALIPVYVNGQRASVYSPAAAQFTLRTTDPPAKWTLRSAALLLQDETA